MNICFEAEKDNPTLEGFLKNWENPTNPMTIATNSTFVEFKVTRVDNLYIIQQQNILDVIAKFLIYGGTGMLLLTLLIGIYIQVTNYTTVWFQIGLIIVFISALWLSPYFRYALMHIRLRTIGYKGKIEFKTNSYAVSKLLYEIKK